jgi:transcriptional antiterminator NusG
MNYYALHVKTNCEEQYIKRFEALNPASGVSLHFPRRRIVIRRQGKRISTDAPVFPGYIFVETDTPEEMAASRRAFREIEGFCRFLRSNQDVCPLSDRDMEIVLHFTRTFGPVAGVSKVYFDENSKIAVVEGPLAGLEGKIIKVDKRKGRAKIRLDIYDDSFAIDLAFETLEPADG